MEYALIIGIAAAIFVLFVAAIFLLGNGGIRSDRRIGHPLIEARQRDGIVRFNESGPLSTVDDGGY